MQASSFQELSGDLPCHNVHTAAAQHICLASISCCKTAASHRAHLREQLRLVAAAVDDLVAPRRRQQHGAALRLPSEALAAQKALDARLLRVCDCDLHASGCIAIICRLAVYTVHCVLCDASQQQDDIAIGAWSATIGHGSLVSASLKCLSLRRTVHTFTQRQELCSAKQRAHMQLSTPLRPPSCLLVAPP